MLEEIPENRSCNSIPISEHWCSCHSSRPISDLNSFKNISEFIVKKINELFINEYRDKCVELVLNKTVSVFEQQLSIGKEIISENLCKTNENYCESNESIKHYIITVNVKPSNALFESTINLNTESNKFYLIGDISRINAYRNQSNCIKNTFLEKYCFCRNIL